MTALGAVIGRPYSLALYGILNAASVGPDVPRLRRLGPVGLNNTFVFFTVGSTRKPIKQFCISSQFCGPQTISFVGSGFHLLFAELSKCAIPMIRVPVGSAMGLTMSTPSCQL